jgi:hypothetical protein
MSTVADELSQVLAHLTVALTSMPEHVKNSVSSEALDSLSEAISSIHRSRTSIPVSVIRLFRWWYA